MCSFAYVSAYDAHIFTGRVCPPDGRSSQDSTALGSGWNTHSEADSDRSARLHGRRSATGVGFSRSAEAIDCLLPGVERGPEAGSQEPKASAGTVLYLSRNRASRIARRGWRGNELQAQGLYRIDGRCRPRRDIKVDRRSQGSIGEVWVRLVFAFLRDQRVRIAGPERRNSLSARCWYRSWYQHSPVFVTTSARRSHQDRESETAPSLCASPTQAPTSDQPPRTCAPPRECEAIKASGAKAGAGAQAPL